MKCISILFLLALQCNLCCKEETKASSETAELLREKAESKKVMIPTDTSCKVIHIFVALCDNRYQGIVPVPERIGNGQDPNNNLYWGCAFGIRTYFKNSSEWKLLRTQQLDTLRLERIIFKHCTKQFYLIADAYNGKYIKECTEDFLRSSCGGVEDTVTIENKTIGIGGNADLLSYIGHDGLMDFQVTEHFVNKDTKQRDVIILACYSKTYFSPHLRQANVNPLVWTTGLMAPEAYTIHDAITGYVNNESNENIRTRAALAYSKYQKSGEKAARKLLATGW